MAYFAGANSMTALVLAFLGNGQHAYVFAFFALACMMIAFLEHDGGGGSDNGS